MVPSWTETLIEAGADVVGRTRFCIHPESCVAKIKAVGGTKDVDWTKLAQTDAVLLILDREENPLMMSENAPCRTWASHIKSVDDMPVTLRKMAELFDEARDHHVAQNLQAFALRWEQVLATLRAHPLRGSGLPVIKEWLRRPPERAGLEIRTESRYGRDFKNIIYLIWKNPYMSASRDTFIGSMLSLFKVELSHSTQRYPEIQLAMYDPQDTLLLFSSEPYPFEKNKDELAGLPYASALVDGELYSWFGLRSLRFLENCAACR